MLRGIPRAISAIFDAPRFPLSALPKAIVFDVDYTLWPYWVDTHTSPPYARAEDGVVRDGSGERMALFPETAEVLLGLRGV